jgi:hypothetical protein
MTPPPPAPPDDEEVIGCNIVDGEIVEAVDDVDIAFDDDDSYAESDWQTDEEYL